MHNPWFRFKQFTVYHDRCAMKVTTDGCLFGAWVAGKIREEETKESKPKLLDIGTGTGLLSLMVAQKNDAQTDAIEIDLAASEQANENIAASLWKENIKVLKEDLLQWRPSSVYNCIFSNPPFYENDLRAGTTAKNVAHHDGGLTLHELLLFIRNHLKPGGSFFLLLPAKREAELALLMRKQGLHLQEIVRVQQTLKHQPFRVMIKGRLEDVDWLQESSLSIRGDGDEYTPAFTALLKDYYLYL